MTQPSSVVRQEIVFVFDNLPDWQQLVAGVQPGVQAIVLDGTRDGLAQISEHLQGLQGIDAIHILSHGQPGSLQLGSFNLDQAELVAHADTLAQIGSSLSDDGDILLYGCDTASGEKGVAYISQWAKLTQADVAASTNLTGAKIMGGDWILEATSGSVDSSLALSMSAFAGYNHALALANQPFDAETPGMQAVGSEPTGVTIGGLTYWLEVPMPIRNEGGINLTSNKINFSITPTNDDLALIFNNSSSNLAAIGDFRAGFKSADGAEFRMISMEVDTGTDTGTDTNLTFKGYRDGVEVVSDVVDTSISDSAGSMTFVRNGVANGQGGTLTFNSDWDNIDEIRISGFDTMVAIDDLVFNAGGVPDSTPPTVTSVTSSTANGAYKAGDEINVQVNFSEDVNVDTAGGTPQLTLETGATDRTINYSSGSGSSTLNFTYTVQAGDNTGDLDYLASSALALNSGTIKDTAGNNAVLTLPAPGSAGSLGANKALVVDGVAPTIASVAVPASATYSAGQNLDFTVNFSEVVVVDTTGGTPRIAITLDTGGTTYASYVSGSGTSALMFRAIVQTGWQDSNGISIGGTIDPNGGSLQDTAGNIAASNLTAVGALAGVLVDAVAPAVSSISLAGAAVTNASSVQYTVVFSKAITGLDASDFALAGSGVAGILSGVSGSGTTYTVTVSSITGNGTLRLDLNSSDTGITDSAGNAIAAGYTAGGQYTIDNMAPATPVTPTLEAASDSGASNADGVTSVATPVISGTAESGSTVTLYDTDGTTVLGTTTATGGVWSITSSTLAPGAHSLTVKSTDIAGNTSAASSALELTIDTTAPATPAMPMLSTASDSGASNSDGVTSATTPVITGTAEAGSTVTLYDTDGTTVLGTTTAAGGVWSITSSTLAPGAHSLTVKSTDIAGNTSAASSALEITIDTTAPATPATPVLATASDSGASNADGVTSATTPVITGTAEAGSTVTLYDTDGTTVLGTTTAAGGVWSITSSTLAPGAHSLTVKSTDIAGNTSAASSALELTIDTTAPATPTTPVLATASDSGASNADGLTRITTPIVSGTAEAGTLVTLYDTDGTTVLGTALAAGGVWSITSSTLADGAHSLTVTATDLAGNVSASSADLSLIIDTAAPVFASAAVNGKTLVLNYTETSTLDALNLPAPGAFNVLVGAVPNVVTAVAVDPVAKTVTLTLTNAVAAGNAVTVAYEDLSADNDANAIQDLAGNDAATLTATAVTNNTPSPPVIPTEPTNPTVPPVVSVPVDGVNVTTTTGDGGTTIITVPVVRPTRVDDPNTPDSGLADIPIVKTAGGRSILEVGVPVGVAVKAQGVATGLRSDAALNELLTRIESAGGNTEQLNLGRTFDSTVSPTTTLHIQTLTLSTGAGFDASVPLAVRGSALPGDGLQAVILDARALPSGSLIQVDNVDFVTVIGAVRIIGGAGQNTATGDGAAQYIVLGADDDIIHGGGGNDTVGSKGGNDEVYGDAGDDIVFGGAGNDLLSGGNGSDRINGGTGFDMALQEGKRSDYSITLDGAGIKLTHIASGVADWLIDVEQVRFENGAILTLAHSAAEEAAAFLFQKWMGRDLTQSEGAVIQTLDGLNAVQVADLFIQVFPQQAGGKTAQQLLEGMAGAGAIRVDAVREAAFVGDAGDNTIAPPLGLAWTVDGGTGIDTLVFPAILAQTHIEVSADGFTLQRMTDGAMLELANVERVTLEDTKLALDLDGHAGTAAKLIGAVAGAAQLNNKPLVGEVIRALDAGVSAQSLAQLGLQVLGAQTPGQVTQLLWTNVVGSAATPAQLQPFVNMMAQGVTGGELAVLASNLDLNAMRIDLVGLAATGIEFA